MTQKTLKQQVKRRKVKFSFDAAEASQVVLMGDFNKWDPKVHPMKKDEAGTWTKSLMLPPGKYEYKFLIDGQWKADPKNKKTCPNCFGSYNSVLDLKLK